MGFATLFAVPVFARQGIQRWLRWFFLANGLLTPVIAFVYFYPYFSIPLLLLGLPWLITGPGSMLLLALFFKKLIYPEASYSARVQVHQRHAPRTTSPECPDRCEWRGKKQLRVVLQNAV